MGDTNCPKLDPKLYSQILEKCLTSLNLPIEYSLIGGRTCGNAYLSHGRVYKVTTDKSEAVESNKVVGKNNSHLVDVYNVKKINTDLTPESVYLIVMEYVNTGKQSIFAEIQENLINLFREHLNLHLFDLLEAYRFKPEQYAAYEPDVKEALAPHQKETLYYNTLLEILDELKANGVESIDVHYHNLGVKQNGNIAFFDFGFGDEQGEVDSMGVNEKVELDEEIKQLYDALGKNGISLQDFAIKLSDRLGFEGAMMLGSGTQGAAIDVGGGTVMKITTDNGEASEANHLVGKNNQYIGNVFKVYKLDPPYNFAYVILREKLKVDSQENSRREKVFEKVMDDNDISWFTFDEIIMRGNKQELEETRDSLRIRNNADIEVVDAFFAVFGNLIDNGIKSTDFAPNNFGFKNNGAWAYYDLGYSSNPEDLGGVEGLAVNERVVSYMPNSSAMSVKKKCQIGGNGDGTSSACNQGDISNIKLNKISEHTSKWKQRLEKKQQVEENMFYRVPSGFTPPRGTTALDVVNFERNENGNVEEMDIALENAKKHGIDLAKYPASSVIWVTKTPEDAMRYGNDVEEEPIENPIILTTDGDNGYLVFRKEGMIAEEQKVEINDLPFKGDVEAAGGKIYSVGGAVRDSILGKESKDLDILITGLPLDQLETILSKYGRVDNVGKSFGIIKYNSPQTGEIDIAIPRTERKNDQGGYQGFDVTSDHNLPIEKDLERRDFTINAIAKDSSGLMIDPYGGQGDIQKKQIKMVNPQAFSDDPLRMLRAVQFASRFGFSIEPETLASIQQNASKIREISPERILIEFDKIVKKGNPMVGAKLLRQTGLYNQIFGVDRGVNFAPFDHVKTMGEFVFSLIKDNIQNPAEYFKDHMKGDLDTYNNIRALELGNKFNGDKKTIFDMYKIYPQSLNTDLFGPKFKDTVEYMKAKNIPFSLKEVPVNGNDLMSLGFQGKEIGNAFVNVLNKIYSEELPNNREDILNYVKTLKV